jgi:hypothetical protein
MVLFAPNEAPLHAAVLPMILSEGILVWIKLLCNANVSTSDVP